MSVQDYEQLFKRNYERLYYHSLDIVRDDEVARDVVSDVFVNVWHLRETIIPETVLSYLYTSVRNRSLDQLRINSRNVPLIEEVIHEMEQYNDTDWDAYEARIKALKEELSRQPKRVRRVLQLRYFEHKSNQEVADILDISVDGVKKIIQRSFAQLRVLLGKKILNSVLFFFLSSIKW